MEQNLETTSSITIDSAPARVWEALTTPETIKEWFFGVDTLTDWSVGSSIVHRGVYQGHPYEDKGTILAFEPPRLLVHSHWSPVSGLPDSPENYQEVSWSLMEHDGSCELVIREVNLPSEEARAVSEQGWRGALRMLKDLVER
jgi:uncharacterized protein YndB with AHSA1/START domain